MYRIDNTSTYHLFVVQGIGTLNPFKEIRQYVELKKMLEKYNQDAKIKLQLWDAVQTFQVHEDCYIICSKFKFKKELQKLSECVKFIDYKKTEGSKIFGALQELLDTIDVTKTHVCQYKTNPYFTNDNDF